MAWFPYILLAYVALAMQVALAPFATGTGTVVNLPLVAAVFIAINAPRNAALFGCFGIGLLQDLLTQQPPGLYAFSYGLVATILSATQATVHRGHPLTHFFLTALSAVITSVVLMLHSLLHPSDARLTLQAHLMVILYTSLVSPVVVGLLNRVKRLFAFQTPRRRLARG